MDLGALRDRAFRIYRTNQLPMLSVAHKDTITSLVARYFYTKYINSSGDLIPRFRSENDVKVSTLIERGELHDLAFLHISIEHGSSTQTVVFMQKNEKYLAFIRSAMPLFLTEVLESLDLQQPLALQQIALTPKFITNCVNGLSDIVSADSSVFGQTDVSFVPRKALTGNSLKEIKVSFPKEDTNNILQKDSTPLNSLYEWLTKSTTLKFENLDILSFSCNLVTIKSNLVSILCPLTPENQFVGLLTTILESTHA